MMSSPRLSCCGPFFTSRVLPPRLRETDDFFLTRRGALSPVSRRYDPGVGPARPQVCPLPCGIPSCPIRSSKASLSLPDLQVFVFRSPYLIFPLSRWKWFLMMRVPISLLFCIAACAFPSRVRVVARRNIFFCPFCCSPPVQSLLSFPVFLRI